MEIDSLLVGTNNSLEPNLGYGGALPELSPFGDGLLRMMSEPPSGVGTSSYSLALEPESLITEDPWPMYPVASALRGPNSISPADVNGDGRLDYLTNYQFDQSYAISLHPGEGGNPKLPWEQVLAFQPDPLTPTTGVNPENATFADVDGDGQLDIIGAQGWSSLEFFDGSQPGIRVLWGEGTTAPERWSDGGVIPATAGRGHFLYVRPLDINGDGLMDIVAGGRRQGDNGIYAGLSWLEAPAPPEQRRDLSLWQSHPIAPNQFTGFGFELVDLDGDSDLDLVLANNDFDTPPEEIGIFWYENPGAASSQLRSPWAEHTIDKISAEPEDPLRELYTKAQVAIGDVDGDGLDELLAQTRSDFLIYDKPSEPTAAWTLTLLSKPPELQWAGRALELVDLDGDGDLDLAGMLTHENQVLPVDKAAVFWMENAESGAGLNFTPHAIKWGAGKVMPITLPDFGEKWDLMFFDDVDGDGDLDVMADCEEWWVDKPAFRFFWIPPEQPVEAVSVVWFENRLGEAAPGFQRQADGSYLTEAESFSRLEGPEAVSGATSNTLTIRSRYSGFTGDGYLQVLDSLPSLIPAGRDETLGAEYDLTVPQGEGGIYYLWVWRYVPEQWGAWRGGDASNSAWLSVDGMPLGNSLLAPVFDNGGDYGVWKWVRSRAFCLAPGHHTITLRGREGGYAVDRLALSRNPHRPPA